MKYLAIISLVLLVAAPLVGCGDEPPAQATPTTTAPATTGPSGASPPAGTAPVLRGDAELEAARVLLRYERSRVDGIMPPASWPEPDAVRRLGKRAWVVDIDTSRLPGGYPEQLIVEVVSVGGHTGRPKQ